MIRPLRRFHFLGGVKQTRRWQSSLPPYSNPPQKKFPGLKHDLQRKSSLNVTINSILDTSFKSLEDYLVSTVAPIKENPDLDDTLKFEIEFQEDILDFNVSSIPLIIKSIPLECVDENWGMKLRRGLWLTSYQHLCNEIKMNGSISQRILLNFILRTTPKIQDRLLKSKDPDYRTNEQLKIKKKSLIEIVDICIKLGYLKTAAFALSNFNDINLNEIFTLIPSSFGKYVLAMEVYKFQGDPRRIHDCKLGSNEKLIGKFRYCYFLYMRNHQSFQSLDNDWKFWIDNVSPNDEDINLIYKLRKIDLIKNNLELPIIEYKKFINTQIKEKIPSFDMSILLNHMFNTTDKEIYDLNNTTTTINLDDFKTQKNLLRNQLLEYIIGSKKWQLDIPMIRFLLVNLDGSAAMKVVGDYIWLSRNTIELTKIDNFNPIQSYLFDKLVNNVSNVYYDEITTLHFNLLLSSKKYSILMGSIREFLDSGKDSKLVNTIISMNNQIDYTQLLHNSIKELFSSGGECRDFEDLLKYLDLISLRSPLVKLKESGFKYGNKILKERIETLIDDEKWKEIQNLYKLLLNFSINHKTHGNHIWRLTPSLLRLSGLVSEKKRQYDKLTEVFNLTVNYICFAPRLLYILNPKGYPSKVYIQSQILLQDMARVLFMSQNDALLQEMIQSRVKWIANDQFDWVGKFKRTLFKFGIFLEVFIRHGIRSKYYNEIPRYQNFFQRTRLDNELAVGCFKSNIWNLIEKISRFNNKIPIEIVEGADPLGSEVLKILDSIDTSVNKSLSINKVSEYEDNSVQDPLDDDLDDDILGYTREENTQLNLRQDVSTFNEVYQVLQKFKRRRKSKEVLVNDAGGTLWDDDIIEISHKSDKTKESNLKGELIDSMKRKYMPAHKLVMVELYSPLRVKSKLIESMIYQEPRLVDPMIEKIFEDYKNKPPVILIQSMMIGLIKSPNLKFKEKINLVKVMDKICAIIYDDKHSQMFKLQVRFTEMKVELVYLIINESAKINGGSLRTLNWAMKKVINLDNLSKYNNQLNNWNNMLTNMRETKTGFWNPTFKDWYD